MWRLDKSAVLLTSGDVGDQHQVDELAVISDTDDIDVFVPIAFGKRELEEEDLSVLLGP